MMCALLLLVLVDNMKQIYALTFVTLDVEILWSNHTDGGLKPLSIYSDQRPEDALADFLYPYVKSHEIEESELPKLNKEYLHLICNVLTMNSVAKDNNIKLCDGEPARRFVMELEWPELMKFTAADSPAFAVGSSHPPPTLIIRQGYSVLYYSEIMCGRIGKNCNEFSGYYIRDKLTKSIHNLPKLKGCGFNPTNILDIGANIGEWARQTQKLFPDANIFMIEGNGHCQDKLAATGIPYEITLVGNYRGNSTYYIDSHDLTSTGNSIFKENSGLFIDALEVTVPINTIDNIIADRNLPPFQYMKMDIQGAELIALQGATKALTTIEVIITEAAVMEYNDFGNSFIEMYVTLDKLGYAMFDVVEVLRDSHNNVAIQFDVLWVRMDSPLWKHECTGYPTPRYFNLTSDNDNGSLMPADLLAKRAFYQLTQRRP